MVPGTLRVVEGVATVADVDDFLAQLREIGDRHDVVVQALDARYVVDRAHLERAVALARRAIERDEAVARDPAVELLLYAAGRRQIDEALTMGVQAGETPVVVVVHDPAGDEGGDETESTDAAASAAVGDAADAIRDLLAPAEALGAYDRDRVREFFEVGDAELAAAGGDLPALVRERVALLVVER